MGPDAMIFVFWMLSFKPAFSFSSFTFIKRLFSSSSLSAIRVVLSAYLRLLIFLLAILIPACASSSPAFHMMYSAYKLNKQSDNKQSWCTLFLIWNQSVVPCRFNCCFLTCIQISWEAGQVVWYFHLFKNFPQFVVIHTVRHLPLVGSLSSAKKFKYIVIAPPFSLHLLSSLISNCSKLPFGTQGRSWRLEANPCEQEMGGGEHSKVPRTRSPTGSCLVSKPFHFQINGGQGSRSNFPNISQAAESRAELRTQVSQLFFLMNWFHPVQLLNSISGSSTPCQDDILQFGESPWHFAPGKPASWRLKQKISSTEFLEDLTSCISD